MQKWLRKPRPSRCAGLIAALAAVLAVGLTGCAEFSEPPLNNTVRWSTASESDTFGYDVYRAESREGPFRRITPNPVLGGGTTDLVQRYEFADDTIESGTPYYYYVERILLSGRRERLTPVFEAPEK